MSVVVSMRCKDDDQVRISISIDDDDCTKIKIDSITNKADRGGKQQSIHKIVCVCLGREDLNSTAGPWRGFENCGEEGKTASWKKVDEDEAIDRGKTDREGDTGQNLGCW
jgi:hypothetical protein